MQTVNDYLKKVGVYYIATVEGDQPRVRPFGTVNLFQDKLYIQTGKKKDFYKQISINPKVEICAYADEAWLRITATLVEDNRIEPQESLFSAYPGLKNRYAINDGNNVVFYLKNATATFSNFDGTSRLVEF